MSSASGGTYDDEREVRDGLTSEAVSYTHLDVYKRQAIAEEIEER